MGIASYASYFREQVVNALQLDPTYLNLAQSFIKTAGIVVAIYATTVLIEHLRKTAEKTTLLFHLIISGNTEEMKRMLDNGTNPEAIVFSPGFPPFLKSISMISQ